MKYMSALRWGGKFECGEGADINLNFEVSADINLSFWVSVDIDLDIGVSAQKFYT